MAHGPENNRGFRYFLVLIDNFFKFGGTVPLKNKTDQKKQTPLETFSNHPTED